MAKNDPIHVITGGAGFIGHHLAHRLVEQGMAVTVIDKDGGAIVQYKDTYWGKYVLWQHYNVVHGLNNCHIGQGDYAWALAADMGGMGYIGVPDNDLNVSTENALINAITVRQADVSEAARVFFASSACVYNETKQMETVIAPLKESDALPAQPDTIYGWEKLYAEFMYQALGRSGIPTRIARFHNVFGPEGTWRGGREKAPAAICRKVAVAKFKNQHKIELWGDGEQRRSFLYIRDALDGILALMKSSLTVPVNIGQDTDISINELAYMAADIAHWEIEIVHVAGPQGVRGRNADITMAKDELAWSPQITLRQGMELTYAWIEQQALTALRESDLGL